MWNVQNEHFNVTKVQILEHVGRTLSIQDDYNFINALNRAQEEAAVQN